MARGDIPIGEPIEHGSYRESTAGNINGSGRRRLTHHKPRVLADEVAEEATGDVRGDVNLDGVFDIIDASFTIQYLAKMITEAEVTEHTAVLTGEIPYHDYNVSKFVQL